MIEFSLLRPQALWLLLLLLPLVVFLQLRQSARGNPWQTLIDAPLLAALQVESSAAPRLWPLRGVTLGVGLAAILAILALAGPSLGEREVPTVPPQAEAVIVLSLAPSMRAADLSPDRLTRARIAIAEWLDLQDGVDVGLVTYAGSAFRVSPLTQDAATLKNFLAALQPDVLPRPGADMAAGLRLARTLFSERRGSKVVLLVSDGGAPADAREAAAELLQQQIQLQILSVGTAAGAPVPLANGQFASQPDGSLLLARTDLEAHAALARSVGGDWADVRQYRPRSTATATSGAGSQAATGSEAQAGPKVTRLPRDDGPWLLLPLLALLALLFRRGVILLLVAAILPATHPAQAQQAPDWLLNQDQRSVRQWQRSADPQAAAAISDPSWRGLAQYEAGEYAAAAAALADSPRIADRYNHALALAQQGELEAAMAGFEAVLEDAPEHAKARANRDLLRQVLEQESAQNESNSESESSEDGADQTESDSETSNQSGSDATDPQNSSGEPGSASADEAESAERPPADGTEEPDADSQSETNAADASDTPDPADAADADEAASLTQSDTLDDAEEQALRQWLRRVETDPARLLRERFRRLEAERARESQRN